MTLLTALILGLVQGLTEFIPVSSSGHLEIVQQLFGDRSVDFHYFLELINLGTLAALLIYYRKRIAKILSDIFVKHDFKFALNVILTCIPAGLAGILLGDLIENAPFFSTLYTIAIAMGGIGILMIYIDKLPHLKKLKDENALTKKRAFGIGCAQVLALIPGASRSGTTILAGRIVGLDSKSAADYSFLASIPLVAGVCAKTLLSSSARAYVSANAGMILLANVVAFASGLLAINFVLNYLKKPGSLKVFGTYRLIVATLVLIFVLLA